MSFRCEKCGQVSTKLIREVVETRKKEYFNKHIVEVKNESTGALSLRIQHTPVMAKPNIPFGWDSSRGKFRSPYRERKQATGWEIVKEINVCPNCTIDQKTTINPDKTEIQHSNSSKKNWQNSFDKPKQFNYQRRDPQVKSNSYSATNSKAFQRQEFSHKD